jgi:uncharacterized protein (TIGR03118 family)
VTKSKSTAATSMFESLESRRLMSVPAITQTNLTSDGTTPGTKTDTNLVNSWGIAIAPGGAIWVANNGSGTTTLYDAQGNPNPGFVVQIPPAQNTATRSAPTGAAYNPSTVFAVSENGQSAPAEYVFDGEDGRITAWSPSVDLNNAIVMVDNSASGAVYKGITLATGGLKKRMFAANFHSGQIDIFNGHFKELSNTGKFVDPTLPAGFAPHNVQRIPGAILVMYAKTTDGMNPVIAAHKGIVDEFTKGGVFIKRLATRGTLNAPWGAAIAPSTFGDLAGDILIGNFGDGRINAYRPDGTFDGQLMNASNQPIMIDGLWSLTPGTNASLPNTLFFSAGPVNETEGLFGTLTAA